MALPDAYIITAWLGQVLVITKKFQNATAIYQDNKGAIEWTQRSTTTTLRMP